MILIVTASAVVVVDVNADVAFVGVFVVVVVVRVTADAVVVVVVVASVTFAGAAELVDEVGGREELLNGSDAVALVGIGHLLVAQLERLDKRLDNVAVLTLSAVAPVGVHVRLRLVVVWCGGGLVRSTAGGEQTHLGVGHALYKHM